MIESERAKNVKIIDMRDKCDWTNWMVIAEGLSERHLGNLADQIYSAVRMKSALSPLLFCCFFWFVVAIVEHTTPFTHLHKKRMMFFASNKKLVIVVFHFLLDSSRRVLQRRALL
jgi:hypothetical protein